jgi:Putative 8-oxoguanine DNA glycosylase OGG-like protein
MLSARSLPLWPGGRVGYGPFRVERVLAGTRDPAACLQSAASELASSGPLKAYALLGDNGMPRLPHLGPAFGTKYLYFCPPPRDHPALILDRLVAAWLRDNTNLRLNETRWSSHAYERYLSAMFQWADEMGVAADELEACIFSEQAEATISQWRQRLSSKPRTR